MKGMRNSSALKPRNKRNNRRSWWLWNRNQKNNFYCNKQGMGGMKEE
jgi:hypothetical protein